MKVRSVLATVLLSVSGTAVAAGPAQAHQPYGGCDESWQVPRSEGAEHCRSHGWVVRPRFVIDAKGRLRYSRMPVCEYEDCRGCIWFAHLQGNKQGTSFITGPKGRVFPITFMIRRGRS